MSDDAKRMTQRTSADTITAIVDRLTAAYTADHTRCASIMLGMIHSLLTEWVGPQDLAAHVAWLDDKLGEA